MRLRLEIHKKYNEKERDPLYKDGLQKGIEKGAGAANILFLLGVLSIKSTFLPIPTYSKSVNILI